jgi:hypothetical protein
VPEIRFSISRGCFRVRRKDRTKAKGDLPFEISPLLSDFSKIRFGAQITTTRHSRAIRDVRAEPAVTRTPSSHSLQELSCSIRGSQLPECCVRLVSDSLAGPLSDSLAGLVSEALPSSVTGSHPNLVPDSHPEFLHRSPCGSRFQFSWRSFPGALASSASGSPTALVYSLLLEDCSSVDL